MGDERYPDVSLPSVLPLPNPPMTADQTVLYVKQLHNVLAVNQTRLAEAIRVLSYHRSTVSTDADAGYGGVPTGGTDNMPPASGSRVIHVDEDETTGLTKLFIDLKNTLGVPEWFELNSLKELYITDPMWDDLRFAALDVKVPATGGPGFAQFMDDGAGSTGVFTYWFSPTAEESVYVGPAQMPHDWLEGSDIDAHVHWTPAANAIAPGLDVSWGVEYTWSNIGAVFPNTTIIYGDEQQLGAGETLVVDKHYLTEIGTINATGKTLSSCLFVRLFRDATGVGGTDDFPSDAGIIEFDFHYQRNSLGSKEEYVKGP